MLTNQDIENGKKSLEGFLIKPRTPENAKKGLIYAILTRGKRSENAQALVDLFQEKKLLSLMALSRLSRKQIKRHLRSRFYKGIHTCFKETYNYFNKYNWVEQLASPYKMRETMVKNIKGMGLKTSSFWLRNCKADIAVIDRHILKYLISRGFEYDKKTRDGKIDLVHFSPKDYQKAEEFLKELVKKDKRFHNQGYQPLALFDATVWYKYSNTEKK